MYIGRLRLLSDVHILYKLMLGEHSHVAVAGHCSQGEADEPALPANPSSPNAVIGAFGVDQPMCFWGSRCGICNLKLCVRNLYYINIYIYIYDFQT